MGSTTGTKSDIIDRILTKTSKNNKPSNKISKPKTVNTGNKAHKVSICNLCLIKRVAYHGYGHSGKRRRKIAAINAIKGPIKPNNIKHSDQKYPLLLKSPILIDNNQNKI